MIQRAEKDQVITPAQRADVVSAATGVTDIDKALVLTHRLDVSGAEIAETRVLRLMLVILERLEKGLMLHDSIVDLTFQKIDTAVHMKLLFG